MNASDKPILVHIKLGKLSFALFKYWLGFEYADFKSQGKRLDFGFIKFWWGI